MSGPISHGSTSDQPAPPSANPEAAASPAKRRRPKNRKRRARTQSFVIDDAPPSTETGEPPDHDHTNLRDSFYRLEMGNVSGESLESEALLDHRDEGPLQTRRQSIQQAALPTQSRPPPRPPLHTSTSRIGRARTTIDTGSHHGSDVDVSTPLLGASFWGRESPSRQTVPMATAPGPLASRLSGIFRRRSPSSTRSTRSPRHASEHAHSTSRDLLTVDFDINNPPSVPGSPRFDADHGLRQSDDVAGDLLIDMDGPLSLEQSAEMPGLGRRLTVAAEEDVCFPQDILSEIAEEEVAAGRERRRHRRRAWPDLAILLEWSVMEKEQRVEGIRARRVNEPLLVDGRLRARKAAWRREVEDAPYRFTYFNEEFETTIHSQTISELVQPGQTFEDLFIPKPPIISDDSSEEETSGHTTLAGNDLDRKVSGSSGMFRSETTRSAAANSFDRGTNTPDRQNTGDSRTKTWPRPVFWLDVLNPSDAEMKVLSKAFGIHPLTAEDILMQEAREKVELFRHYYFVNYRSFEQDVGSDDYMEPVNMYVVVFREGILSFHFSQTPHPANVRRRIRQLSDYLFVTTDWISYAIIDDVTDAYIPLIQNIEDEVDGIDDLVLGMQGGAFPAGEGQARSHADMLRRMGDSRKTVMRLYRLLSTKADVIKGFAKRCNEQWEVAPKSEIGMYLGDIQDHIVTMTGNLSHYENILSRAHSNYLAQINIHMTERAERTNDVLGKLTVLGTIMLPMSVVTSMWGMNVRVPGERADDGDLRWFFAITGGLLVCGMLCYVVARRFLSSF